MAGAIVDLVATLEDISDGSAWDDVESFPDGSRLLTCRSCGETRTPDQSAADRCNEDCLRLRLCDALDRYRIRTRRAPAAPPEHKEGS